MKLKFDIAGELVSTNEMYIPRSRKGGRSAYLTKSPKYRELEPIIMESLNSQLDEETLSEFKKELDSNNEKAIELKLELYIPESKFFRSDCSNYIKVIEDCVKNLISVDDSRNCRIIIEKFLSDEWYSQLTLKTYDYSFSVNQSPKWSSTIIK